MSAFAHHKTCSLVGFVHCLHFVVVVVVVVIVVCSVGMDVVIIICHHDHGVVCLFQQKINLQSIMGDTNGQIMLQYCCYNVNCWMALQLIPLQKPRQLTT